MRIPLELVDLTLRHYIHSQSPSTVLVIRSLIPVLLSCSVLHSLALNLVLAHIHFDHRPADMNKLWSCLKDSQFNCIKCLSIPSWAISTEYELVRLTSLNSIIINCDDETINTLSRSLSASSLSICFLELPIQSLTLIRAPLIGIPLLQAIVAAFPRLTDLTIDVVRSRLSRVFNQADRDYAFCSCIGCVEEELECMFHSPVPFFYSSIDVMTVRILSRANSQLILSLKQKAFAIALKPLHQLHRLRLGILLSDEHLLQKHIWHMINTVTPSLKQPRSATNLLVNDTHAREWQAVKNMKTKLPHLTELAFYSLYPHKNQATHGNCAIFWNTYQLSDSNPKRGGALGSRRSSAKMGNGFVSNKRTGSRGMA